jgi:hypothetical protein
VEVQSWFASWIAASNKPGVTLLKLFQNVPKADLEMLIPNTTVRMFNLDKLLIGDRF